MKRKMGKAMKALSLLLILSGIAYALYVFSVYHKGQREYADLASKVTTRIIDNADDFPLKQNPGEKETGLTEDKDKESAPEMKADENADTDSKPSLPADSPERIKVDFDLLKKENSDVCAWIDIPAVSISYPVMKAKDNDYYLHRDINGNYLFAGSIFIDSACSSSFRDYNTIIYGHNMRDKSMFGNLQEFWDGNTLETCPYFWIYTPSGDFLYKIFSACIVPAASDVYRVRFASAADLSKYLREMKDLSEISIDTCVGESDRVVTLSTCSSDSSLRRAVLAEKVGEAALDG